MRTAAREMSASIKKLPGAPPPPPLEEEPEPLEDELLLELELLDEEELLEDDELLELDDELDELLDDANWTTALPLVNDEVP